MGFLGKTSKTKARVVLWNESPCLFVAFEASVPPLVWQFDLGKMPTYVIALRETNGEWDLGLRLPQGVFSGVAHFDERHEAEEAYKVVQRALLHQVQKASPSRWWQRLLMVLGVVFLASFIWGVVPTKGGKESSTSPLAPIEKKEEEKITPPPQKEIQTGVPVPADEVLSLPEN